LVVYVIRINDAQSNKYKIEHFVVQLTLYIDCKLISLIKCFAVFIF
jgi:hypothetical protein